MTKSEGILDLSAEKALEDAPRRTFPVARPYLGDEEVEAVARVLRSGWVTQGNEVSQFEHEFAKAVGAPHACAVSSCTAALHLALVALEVGTDDEVITVSHSFIATANVVRYVGALPVFVDVDPVNGNIEPAQIEGALSPATKAILVVHQLGMPCDLAAVLKIGRKHNLPVIEDAACAIGSELMIDGNWQTIGSPLGRIACFSFHPRKLLTTGDGGMITTADLELDRKFRLLRQHGMSVPDRVRHSSPTFVAETYDCLGFNYRMTDIQAAVGRVQLRRLPQIISERRAQAQVYDQLLRRLPGIRRPQEPEWARSNWQTYCIQLPGHVPQVSFMQALLDRGISTRRGVMCSHREQAYERSDWRCAADQSGRETMCNCPPFTCSRLAQGEHIQDHGVALPLYPGLTRADQEFIVETIADCLKPAQEPVERRRR